MTHVVYCEWLAGKPTSLPKVGLVTLETKAYLWINDQRFKKRHHRFRRFPTLALAQQELVATQGDMQFGLLIDTKLAYEARHNASMLKLQAWAKTWRDT